MLTDAALFAAVRSDVDVCVPNWRTELLDALYWMLSSLLL